MSVGGRKVDFMTGQHDDFEGSSSGRFSFLRASNKLPMVLQRSLWQDDIADSLRWGREDA